MADLASLWNRVTFDTSSFKSYVNVYSIALVVGLSLSVLYYYSPSYDEKDVTVWRGTLEQLKRNNQVNAVIERLIEPSQVSALKEACRRTSGITFKHIETTELKENGGASYGLMAKVPQKFVYKARVLIIFQ